MPFTLKVATRDFHPPDHISFDSSHPPPHNKAFESSTAITNPQNTSESSTIPIWPAHCVQGTPGAELIPEIDVSKIDRMIDKGRNRSVEMFSAFADAFGNRSDAASFDLAAYFTQYGISRVFIVGLAGDYCVRCTAIDAKQEGFEVFVLDEAVKSIDSGEKGWEAAKTEFERNDIKVVSIDGPEPKLREEVKEDVKNETNKDGSGKGQMTAWKGMKISKEYEKKGGDYENEAGSKNEPAKGVPEAKSEEEKKEETKGSEEKKEDKAEKPKANSGKKATGKKADTKAKAPKKEKKAPTEGTRKSSRIGGKRSAPEEDKKEEKTPAKKAKTTKK
ncbi:MAG: hypothetical protein Q9166_004610 [cf. Caloplaca sp. 2 TL-2023]